MRVFPFIYIISHLHKNDNHIINGEIFMKISPRHMLDIVFECDIISL